MKWTALGLAALALAACATADDLVFGEGETVTYTFPPGTSNEIIAANLTRLCETPVPPSEVPSPQPSATPGQLEVTYDCPTGFID
ncbi:MAG: hypothetical protein AAFQ51_02330 [Pseudomonadota bacterium]